MKALFAIAAIFATAATFASPAKIAKWQNSLKQDAAIYRATAADCRTTAHKDRETVARKFDREADRCAALAAAMTGELADAYEARAAAEATAHSTLVEWQKANTSRAANEAELDALCDATAAALRRAERKLKKAENAALRKAAK